MNDLEQVAAFRAAIDDQIEGVLTLAVGDAAEVGAVGFHGGTIARFSGRSARGNRDRIAPLYRQYPTLDSDITASSTGTLMQVEPQVGEPPDVEQKARHRLPLLSPVMHVLPATQSFTLDESHSSPTAFLPASAQAGPLLAT
jgi:hypothetical protein